MKNVGIIPAILPQDFAELKEKVASVKSGTKWIQLDVCDGQFTPRASWPYRKTDDNFELIVREDQAMPAWETVDYEIDLMVNHPEEVVDDWISAGASRIVLHAEAKGDVKKAIEMLAGRAEVGLALDMETPISTINDMITDGQKGQESAVSFIQLMGIDHIGFQGQEFDEKVLNKIEEVKKAFPDMPISIDGGVSLETAPRLIEAGADRLIVGSAIILAENPLGALEEFQNL